MLFYSNNIQKSFADKNLTFSKIIDDTNLKLKNIYSSGFLKFLKTIIFSLPLLKSIREKKLLEIYKVTFLQIELIRDRELLYSNNISLTSDERLNLKNLIHRVQILAKKKIFNDFSSNIIQVEQTILKEERNIPTYKINFQTFQNEVLNNEYKKCIEPISSNLKNPSFDLKSYINSLKKIPRNLRLKHLDEVIPLDIGMSTETFKNKILFGIQDNDDRNLLSHELKTRENLTTNDKTWNKAIDILEKKYQKAIEQINVRKKEAFNLWNQLESNFKPYLHLLDNDKIFKEFKDWVIINRLNPLIFFQNRSCVKLMNEFNLSNHISICNDEIHLEKNIPHIKVENKGLVSWTELAWNKIFISNEYLRKDFSLIDQKENSNKSRNLYYLADRGLCKHRPLDNDFSSWDKVTPLHKKVVNWNEDAEADITPIISYSNNKPTIVDTHVYLHLRIPEKIFTENGQRKALVNVYSFGVGKDTKIRESKRYKIPYFITKILTKSLKEEPLVFYGPDQNDFYNDRKYVKLKKRINLDKNNLELIRKEFENYQSKEKKSFQLSQNNCTQLPTKIYEILNLKPLPKTLPLYHSIPKGKTYRIVKFLHHMPKFLRKITVTSLSILLGARGKRIQSNFDGHSTWLQRVTLSLVNTNKLISER